jgi:TonB-linked SusC/RagA family outer membrane protein
MYAQGGINVSGTVTDSKGEPLPGVNVVIKGTTTGNVTDVDGKYSLTVSASNTVLKFSFIGYITQEQVVGSKTIINVVLADDAQLIDEVVVVGYGTQRKVTLTGAIASVTGSEIIKTTNENVVNMLSGKVAGLRVIARTSEPGALNSTFDIRGMGSPLLVIDGIPADNATNIARMNPDEIESLTVLKDASAAVYGVRAANGVILITTKKGKEGKVSVKYDGTYGFQKPIGEPDLFTTPQWMDMLNDRERNAGRSNIFTQDQIINSETIDWYHSALNNTAPQYQHNVSVAGGSDKINFYTGVGYYTQDGFAKSGIQKYDRLNVRSNITGKVTENLKVELLLSGMMDDQKQSNLDAWNIYKGLWRFEPNTPVYVNDDPMMPYNAADGFHPNVLTDENLAGYRKSFNKSFSGTANVTYNIPFVKGLSAKGTYSYNVNSNERRRFSKSYTLYDITANPVNFLSPTTMRRDYIPRTNELLQFSLNYFRTFKENHNLKVLALYEESQITIDNFYAQREYEMDALDELFAGLTTNQRAESDAANIWTRVNKGLVGRINYDYLSKYLVEFSFRYDGSSRFAPGKQWGFFPATSLGWRISEESFWKNTDFLQTYLTNFKLRGSYGVMGDDTAAADQFRAGYTYPGGVDIQGGNAISGIGFRAIPNSNLTWYTAKNTNFGFDLDFMNGLIGFQFDWFRRNREGLLANRAEAFPGTLGANMAQENLNSDRTQGFEIILTHTNKIGEFNYAVSGNLGYTRTMDLYQERAVANSSYDNWRNYSKDRNTGILWGQDYDGQFISFDDIWNYTTIGTTTPGNYNVLPGDLKFTDWNEDGIIDEKDMHPIAIVHGSGNLNDNSSKPLYNFGLTLSGEYKGLDFNMLFQGAAGVWMRIGEQYRRTNLWADASGLAMFDDRWKTVGHEDDPWDPKTVWIPGTHPTINKGNIIQYGDNYRSLYEIQNASYLRLKSMEIGYTLSKNWTSKVGIESLRFFVNGYNLLTFTGVFEGVDPEKSSVNHGYEYPLTQTFNFGVNLTF